MSNQKTVVVIGELSDYGNVARHISELCHKQFKEMFVHLGAMLDIPSYISRLEKQMEVKVIFFTPALSQFTDNLISKIRKDRKDIFLIARSETSGKTELEQYLAALALMKGSSCNLILASDTKTGIHMVVTPEEATYHKSTDIQETLKGLVEIAYFRSHLTFTQSDVVAGDPVNWNSELVPQSLREVVNHCIKRKAYKPFNGATVGHFATKLNETTFLTSKRKTNFNDLDKIGLVKVETSGPDTVIAYGAKPSVGGQSQRIIFKDHPGMDCVVHFHSPLLSDHKDDISVVSQREIQCGSHQCGKNTSNGLRKFGNLNAVMLDNHGPNIVFNKNIDPKEVIDFIERNFDLEAKTGGYLI